MNKQTNPTNPMSIFLQTTIFNCYTIYKFGTHLIYEVENSWVNANVLIMENYLSLERIYSYQIVKMRTERVGKYHQR